MFHQIGFFDRLGKFAVTAEVPVSMTMQQQQIRFTQELTDIKSGKLALSSAVLRQNRLDLLEEQMRRFNLYGKVSQHSNFRGFICKDVPCGHWSKTLRLTGSRPRSQLLEGPERSRDAAMLWNMLTLSASLQVQSTVGLVGHAHRDGLCRSIQELGLDDQFVFIQFDEQYELTYGQCVPEPLIGKIPVFNITKKLMNYIKRTGDGSSMPKVMRLIFSSKGAAQRLSQAKKEEMVQTLAQMCQQDPMYHHYNLEPMLQAAEIFPDLMIKIWLAGCFIIKSPNHEALLLIQLINASVGRIFSISQDPDDPHAPMPITRSTFDPTIYRVHSLWWQQVESTHNTLNTLEKSPQHPFVRLKSLITDAESLVRSSQIENKKVPGLEGYASDDSSSSLGMD
jgi:hypothetical protein